MGTAAAVVGSAVASKPMGTAGGLGILAKVSGCMFSYLVQRGKIVLNFLPPLLSLELATLNKLKYFRALLQL
jgi:hypothetical protein